MQDVLGYSALKTGVTFLATAGTAVIAAGVAQALTTRFGAKPIIIIGLTLLTAAMVWYSQIPVHGSYVSDLLPGYLMVGVGIAFAFVPVSIAALAGVAEREAGLASGLINTSQQIGGAIGTAVASTVFTTHFKSLREAGRSLPDALTHGYGYAFWALAFFGLAAIIAAITLIRREDMAESPVAAPIALIQTFASSASDTESCTVKCRSSPEISSARRVSSAGRGEQERAPVVDLRPRLDQHAERGRVDELHLARGRRRPARRVVARLGQRVAHLRRVVEIELAAQPHHAGLADALDREHRILPQSVPRRPTCPPVSLKVGVAPERGQGSGAPIALDHLPAVVCKRVPMDVAAVARRARTENFPVASLLFPRRLRPHLRAVYGFARLVDILGDEVEGDRLAALDELERETGGLLHGHARPGR